MEFLIIMAYMLVVIAMLAWFAYISFGIYTITGWGRNLWHDIAGIHIPDYRRHGLRMNGKDYYACRFCGKMITEYKGRYEIVNLEEDKKWS